MKKLFFISVMLLMVIINVRGQATERDFVFIGQVAGDPNMIQVEMRYSKISNTCFVSDADLNPLSKLTSALEGKQIVNLHIYVRSVPGELRINNVVITPQNIDSYVVELGKLKKVVTGSIIIHSTTVFQSDAGRLLKTKLSDLTGLTITESV